MRALLSDKLGQLVGLMMEHHGLEIPRPWSPPEGHIPSVGRWEDKIFCEGRRHIVLTVTLDYLEVAEHSQRYEPDLEANSHNKRHRYVKIRYEDASRMIWEFGVLSVFCEYSKLLAASDALRRLIDMANGHCYNYEFSNGKKVIFAKNNKNNPSEDSFWHPTDVSSPA